MVYRLGVDVSTRPGRGGGVTWKRRRGGGWVTRLARIGLLVAREMRGRRRRRRKRMADHHHRKMTGEGAEEAGVAVAVAVVCSC